MYKRLSGGGRRHRVANPYVSQGVSNILKALESELKDPALAQSIYFGPTALTHIKRILETGGSIITDTTLVANDIDARLLGESGAQILCFIDDPQVVSLAEQRHVPMSDVCVLAAPTGFASVIQLKERLMDSDLNAIVVRGKKGGVSTTAALLNAILREISENPNPTEDK